MNKLAGALRLAFEVALEVWSLRLHIAHSSHSQRNSKKIGVCVGFRGSFAFLTRYSLVAKFHFLIVILVNPELLKCFSKVKRGVAAQW